MALPAAIAPMKTVTNIASPRPRTQSGNASCADTLRVATATVQAAPATTLAKSAIAGPRATAHLTIDAYQLAAGGEHERQRVLGDGEGIGARRVAHGDAAAARRVQLDVVGAGAPDRDHLEIRAGDEYAVGEARVGADVDGDARAPDALDQLLLVVGAARGVDDGLAELARRLVGGGVLEDAGKVVRDDDCSDGWLHG